MRRWGTAISSKMKSTRRTPPRDDHQHSPQQCLRRRILMAAVEHRRISNSTRRTPPRDDHQHSLPQCPRRTTLTAATEHRTNPIHPQLHAYGQLVWETPQLHAYGQLVWEIQIHAYGQLVWEPQFQAWTLPQISIRRTTRSVTTPMITEFPSQRALGPSHANASCTRYSS